MGQRLGISRNLVSMMEKREGARPPSRTVKLLFEDLWSKSMPAERSDSVGTLSVREGPPPSPPMAEPPSAKLGRTKLLHGCEVLFDSLYRAATDEELSFAVGSFERQWARFRATCQMLPEVLREPPPAKEDKKTCALSNNCPEACPILKTFDHRTKHAPQPHS